MVFCDGLGEQMIPTPRIWISFKSRRNPEEASAAHRCNVSDTRGEKDRQPKAPQTKPPLGFRKVLRAGKKSREIRRGDILGK